MLLLVVFNSSLEKKLIWMEGKDGGERVLTKCVRVSSTATTRAVVEALTDKFLPDLKMLSDDTYSLWE
ncbi:hypothetical protein TELCIR_24333, partial [Teladorsagia circumcincta]